MIDGCLAWERKDTTLEFSLLEQGRLMSGARAVHTQRSCLVWVYVGRSSSCHVVRTAAWCWKSFTLIFPLGSYWLLELSHLFSFSFPCKLLLNVSLCWSRVWSWLDFNVTSVVGLEGKRSIPAVLHGGRHSWLSINFKRHDPPATPKRERAYLIYRMESHHTAAKSTKNGNKNNHRRNHYRIWHNSIMSCDSGALVLYSRPKQRSPSDVRKGQGGHKLGKMIHSCLPASQVLTG